MKKPNNPNNETDNEANEENKSISYNEYFAQIVSEKCRKFRLDNIVNGFKNWRSFRKLWRYK